MTISFPHTHQHHQHHQQCTTTTTTLKTDPRHHPFHEYHSSSDDDNDDENSATHSPYLNSLEYSEQQKKFFTHECLRYGDYISLFTSSGGGASSESTVGFLSVDGINLTCQIEGNTKQIRCGLTETTDISILNSTKSGSQQQQPQPHNTQPLPPIYMIPNFQQCIFQVHFAKSYSAIKKYHHYVNELEIKMANKKNPPTSMTTPPSTTTGTVKVTAMKTKKLFTNIVHESNELAQLKQRMEREIQQNELEAARHVGQPVYYGSTIQLFHVQTQSYLTVARESAEMQKDCLRLSLDQDGSKYSHFSLLPYFNYQKDGDVVKLSDKFRIWNRKSGQFLQFSYYRYSNVADMTPFSGISTKTSSDNYSQIAKEAVKSNSNLKKYSYDNRREVNMSASSAFSHWHLRVFSPYSEYLQDAKHVKAGDIIRIYHKEFDGFLTVNEKTGRVKFKKRAQFMLKSEHNDSSAMMESSLMKSGFSSTSSFSSSSVMKGSFHAGAKDLFSQSSASGFAPMGSHRDGRSQGSQFGVLGSQSSSSSSKSGDENTISSSVDQQISCQSLWQIEMLDSTKGGIVRRNFVFRIRHVSTGYYLMLKPSSEQEDLREEEFEENEVSETNISFLSSTLHNSSIHDFTSQNSISGSTTGISQTTSPASSSTTSSSTTRKVKSSSLIKQPKRELTWSMHVEPQENCHDIMNMLFIVQDAMLSNDISALSWNGQFRIKHYQSGTWLHALFSQKQFSTTGSGDKELATLSRAQYSPVYSVPTLKEQDVLTCFPARREDYEDLFTAQSYIPILKYILSKLNDRTITRSDVKTYINLISSCIRFCTTSDETDPLLRGGIPNKYHQQLMREKGIIALVMEILNTLISHKYLTLEDMTLLAENPEKQDYYDVLQYSYRFIRQAVLMNEVNGLYMAQYINFIQSTIEYSISSSEALLQILSNNFALLNKITEDQIDFFMTLLFKGAQGGSSSKTSNFPTRYQTNVGGYLKKAVYLSFLTSLIICEGKTVVKNQKYISNLLLATYKEQMNKVFLLPRIRKSDNKVVIDINHDEMDLVSFTKSATDTEYVNYSKANFELLVFFQEEIRLFAALCSGSSESTELTRNAVVQLFTYDIVHKCLQEPNLTPALRTSFVNLLLHSFVDTEKRERRILVDLTRKSESLYGKTPHDHTSRELAEVKDFLSAYFKQNAILDMGLDFKDANNFTLSLVQLCRSMLEFGIYTLKDFEDSDLLISLFDILRSDNDKRNGVLLKDEERFKHSEENESIINIKIEIAKIFHMLLDLTLDKRITKFLQFFWMKYRVEDVKTVLADEENSEPTNDKQKQQLYNLRKKEILKVFQEMEQKEHQVLTDIFKNVLPFDKMGNFDLKLLNLTSYENQELATTCLRLLIRKFRAADELAAALPKVELIVSKEMALTYDHLRKQTNDLRSIFGYGRSNYLGARHISDYEVKKAMRALDEILKDMAINEKRSQRIIRNLGLFEIALSVLRNEWMVTNEIKESCLKVLTEFVKENPENQKLLFPYMEFFMRMITEHKKLSKSVVILMCECVRNNRALCSTIEEKHIEQYIDLIAEQRSAFMLLFLRTILSTHNGNPIKRNQSLITKYLLERKKDVVILFKDEEGMRERNNRISKEEHKTEPEGILNYHIALLHLLATAADGKNRESEQRLQTLFTLEELLEQVISPFTLPMIRNPLVKIINEVYVNVEKVTEVSGGNADQEKKSTINIHHPLMYKMFSKMIREFEFAEMSALALNISGGEHVTPQKSPNVMSTSLLANNRASTKPSSAIRQSRALAVNIPSARLSSTGPIRAQITDEDLEKNYIDNYYIFEIMIPVIHNYFHLHFPPPNVTKEQLDIAEDLLLKLIDLHKHTANQEQRDKIFKCVTAMWKKSMSSESQVAITKFVTAKSSKAKVNRTHITHAYVVETDEIINKTYRKYLQRRIISKILSTSEFRKLGNLYEKYNGFVKVLVRILRKLNDSGASYDQSLLDVGLLGLETLKTIVHSQNKRSNGSPKKKKKKSSNDEFQPLDYVEKKLPLVVMELLTSANPLIVKSALELGILILRHGYGAIQKEFYRILTETDTSFFFISVRDRLRLAKKEIKEKKNYLKKKKEKEYALNKERQRKEMSKVRGNIVDNHDSGDSSNINSSSSDQEEGNEEFIEVGHVELLLEFLRLLCEGHNLEMQTILLHQPNNTFTVNVIHESMEYLVALEKKIDFDNIQIAIQGFRTFTEFVQGPAAVIQQMLGTSPRFYSRLVNEILSKTYEDGNLLKQQEVILKKEVVLTLTSLIEGSNTQNLLEIMRNSLNLEELEYLLLFSARLLRSLQADSHHDRATDEVDEVVQRLRKDFDTHFLYEATRDKLNPVVVEDYISAVFPMIRDAYEELGMQIFFLMNIFKDAERQQLRILSRNTFIEETKTLKITNFLNLHQDLLSIFSKHTGSIEVLRNNNIEKVYFPIPRICHNLMDQARHHYVHSLPMMTPEEKVRQLYNDTFSRFYVEMKHYESMRRKKQSLFGVKNNIEQVTNLEDDHIHSSPLAMTSDTIPGSFTSNVSDHNNSSLSLFDTNSSLIPSIHDIRCAPKSKRKKFVPHSAHSNETSASYEFIAHFWEYLRLSSFIFCVVINIVLLGTYKRLYSVDTASDIPVPGDLTFDILNAPKYPLPRTLAGDIIMTIVGAIQLIITATLSVTYLKFFVTLEVKKRFKLKKRETWDSIPRNRQFYWKFFLYILRDMQLWFFVIYFMLSMMGLLISPLVYSIQLFEIVFRFKSLTDVLNAVISNGKKLFFAGMLLLIAMFFFGLLYFSWYSHDFMTVVTKLDTCDTVLACFVSTFDYGFRSEASWENIFAPDPGVGRAILDLSFTLIVIVFLTNVVFGTILDSFQQLRKAREERKKEITEKCFVCALEKSKFDTKANEGITFEKHIKEEHYLWNYVYFLIYLYEKPETEYTGTESYIFQKCEDNDDVTSFFPIFRSKTIEESDQNHLSTALQQIKENH
ncbi:hypothetical protein C9374_006563 [Naegleria lovaniensis]|uniref:MIR domain-containing protein n=1 Tax=Naegleria lovaniensis TaxID=51637 RepID=A0AA88GN53_NAELO|nr:uncharacterized protein C9374_006563 [Naegleria lovaniensis]KAG2379446.1 hypothetical protein C9374_006563 [Naegleria lovaniensis]